MIPPGNAPTINDISIIGSRGRPSGRCPTRGARLIPDRHHMLRRYCPPTSNSALVICPSEHTRTVRIKLGEDVAVVDHDLLQPRERRGRFARRAAAWKSASRCNCDSFSSSVERASSIFCGAASACGLRNVLTPTIG